MADRPSDLPYEAIIEEGTVGVKATPKTINQLTSSAEAAKANRNKKGMQALDQAFQEAAQKEAAEKAGAGKEVAERDSSGQAGKK